MNRIIVLVVLIACATAGGISYGQAAGWLGKRTLNRYWIEGGNFLTIAPATAFDNPTGCTNSSQAIIPASSGGYKEIVAAVMHAMATNKPVSVYAQGCYSAWGQTWPMFYALGVEQ